MPESTIPSESPESQPEAEALPGFRRNLVWSIVQFLLKFVFVTWFRCRSTGSKNLPADSGALLLINHQSFLDPLIVGMFLKRPVSYLARDTLFKVPFIGWLLRNTYVMSISRTAGGTESLRLSINRMKQGYLVGIFPEGTRSFDGKVGQLKPGFIAIVRRSKLPIIPVGICGANRAMPKGSFFIYPVKLAVHYGKPLDPEKVKELTKRGHEEEFIEYVTSEIEQTMEQASQ